jgi:hypothetical protein
MPIVYNRGHWRCEKRKIQRILFIFHNQLHQSQQPVKI